MARLTKEELGGMRLLVRDKRASGFVYVSVHHEHITSALDELEEHRAREGKVERDGVLLSEEAVEKIREALENERVGAMPNSYALLPPKKKPTLLEAAKAMLGWVETNLMPPAGPITKALRAAIEREEGK